MSHAESVMRIGVLACLLEKHEDGQGYSWHCLNLDLVESGETPELAWENLKSAIKAYVGHGYADDPQGLENLVEPVEWEHYAESLKKHCRGILVDEISIELKSASGVEQLSVWLQGVRSSILWA